MHSASPSNMWVVVDLNTQGLGRVFQIDLFNPVRTACKWKLYAALVMAVWSKSAYYQLTLTP